MNVNEIIDIISNYSDDGLKILAKQALTLSEIGATAEYPLRELIDNYPMGDMDGVSAVPQLIMQECTKRWIKSEE
jgi:hypothetical protein